MERAGAWYVGYPSPFPLDPIGVPGIWFPFGIGVRHPASSHFDRANFGAQRERIQKRLSKTGVRVGHPRL